LAADPYIPWRLYVLQVLVDAKQFDHAVADFNKALKLVPAGVAARRKLGFAGAVGQWVYSTAAI
jgi:hypothetical protein